MVDDDVGIGELDGDLLKPDRYVSVVTAETISSLEPGERDNGEGEDPGYADQCIIPAPAPNQATRVEATKHDDRADCLRYNNAY